MVEGQARSPGTQVTLRNWAGLQANPPLYLLLSCQCSKVRGKLKGKVPWVCGLRGCSSSREEGMVSREAICNDRSLCYQLVYNIQTRSRSPWNLQGQPVVINMLATPMHTKIS